MTGNIKKQAILFLVLLGVISLLSDFTHEGARSIYGPFLGLIGASAFVVSFTSGLGEFIGQALRITQRAAIPGHINQRGHLRRSALPIRRTGPA